MARGTRANLERLLRSAWERQTILLAKGTFSTIAMPTKREPETILSADEQSSAKSKSKRQLAVDIASVVALGLSWWAMMEPPNPNYWLGSWVFFVFLGCFWVLVDDFWKTRNANLKKTIMALTAITFVFGYGETVWYRIYHPKFSYAIIFIPAPNTNGPPYHLGLSLANGDAIKYVSFTLYDLTDVRSGEDATQTILQSRRGYAPIIYGITANDTGMEVLCDHKHYHVEMGTEEGSFSEELECEGNDLERQKVNVFKVHNAMPSSWDTLLKDEMPLKKKEAKLSLGCRFLGLCG